MIKDILKDNEPIAYLSIKNDLQLNKIAHCYLFSGEQNKLKIDTAYLLAQSIIEGKNDFACEECATCNRVKNNNYFDLIYINGYNRLIKKEDIEYLIEQFSRTSLEKANKKVYIISNINNSSIKVLNMILKFMEEPSSENVYGILITDDVDGLLPTIVSRCKKIDFKTHDFSNQIKEYKKNGFSDIDSYLLSKINNIQNIDDDNVKELFSLSKEYVFKTIDSLNNASFIPVLFSKDFYNAFKKDDFSIGCHYYLQIFLTMIDDAVACNYSEDKEYMDKLIELSKYNLAKLYKVLAKANDKMKTNSSAKLIFDQISAQIIL